MGRHVQRITSWLPIRIIPFPIAAIVAHVTTMTADARTGIMSRLCLARLHIRLLLTRKGRSEVYVLIQKMDTDRCPEA
jgi:hypothetical protein